MKPARVAASLQKIKPDLRVLYALRLRKERAAAAARTQ